MDIRINNNNYNITHLLLYITFTIIVFGLYLGTEHLANIGDAFSGIVGVGISFYGVYLLSTSIDTNNISIKKQNKVFDFNFMEFQVREMESLCDQIATNAKLIADFDISKSYDEKSEMWDMRLVFKNYFERIDVLSKMPKTDSFVACFEKNKVYFAPYLIRIKNKLEITKQPVINKKRENITQNINSCLMLEHNEFLQDEFKTFRNNLKYKKDSLNNVFIQYNDLFKEAVNGNK